jgi:hypothetical protein
MEDVTVTPAGLGTKTHLVYVVLVDQGQLCTYLTGNFQSGPAKVTGMSWSVTFLTVITSTL